MIAVTPGVSSVAVAATSPRAHDVTIVTPRPEALTAWRGDSTIRRTRDMTVATNRRGTLMFRPDHCRTGSHSSANSLSAAWQYAHAASWEPAGASAPSAAYSTSCSGLAPHGKPPTGSSSSALRVTIAQVASKVSTSPVYTTLDCGHAHPEYLGDLIVG